MTDRLQGRVSRGIPQAMPDTNIADMRLGRYGEVMSIPIHGKKHHLADEGAYFVATNVVMTPIVLTTSIVTFAETAGAVGVSFYVRNNESRALAAAKRIYFDYLKLLCSVVPATCVNWQYAIVLDDNPVRYTSGGTVITPVNPNSDSNVPSIASVVFGAITTAVPNNRRTVARGFLRGVIPTIYDQYTIISGAVEGGGSFVSAAASGKFVEHCPPIIIGPQWNMCLTMWGVSCNNVGQFEFEAGWWER